MQRYHVCRALEAPARVKPVARGLKLADCPPKLLVLPLARARPRTPISMASVPPESGAGKRLHRVGDNCGLVSSSVNEQPAWPNQGGGEGDGKGGGATAVGSDGGSGVGEVAGGSAAKRKAADPAPTMSRTAQRALLQSAWRRSSGDALDSVGSGGGGGDDGHSGGGGGGYSGSYRDGDGGQRRYAVSSAGPRYYLTREVLLSAGQPGLSPLPPLLPLPSLPPLPPGWHEARDPRYGHHAYWYHAETNETTWTRPQ